MVWQNLLLQCAYCASIDFVSCFVFDTGNKLMIKCEMVWWLRWRLSLVKATRWSTRHRPVCIATERATSSKSSPSSVKVPSTNFSSGWFILSLNRACLLQKTAITVPLFWPQKFCFVILPFWHFVSNWSHGYLKCLRFLASVPLIWILVIFFRFYFFWISGFHFLRTVCFLDFATYCSTCFRRPIFLISLPFITVLAFWSMC